MHFSFKNPKYGCNITLLRSLNNNVPRDFFHLALMPHFSLSYLSLVKAVLVENQRTDVIQRNNGCKLIH